MTTMSCAITMANLPRKGRDYAPTASKGRGQPSDIVGCSVPPHVTDGIRHADGRVKHLPTQHAQRPPRSEDDLLASSPIVEVGTRYQQCEAGSSGSDGECASNIDMTNREAE